MNKVMVIDTVKTSKELIAIESTADKPKKIQAALDFIVALLEKDEHITIEHFKRNGKPSILAYYGSVRPDRFKVIFNGHVDVVPGSSGQFKPFIKDGKLYGRGAADMKAAVVIMTKIFLEQAGKLPYPLGLQIVTDEEIGGFDGTKYQLEQGVKADFVIAGEDIVEGAACTEMKGISWVDVTIRGQSAHSGYPWRGENAVVKAQHFIGKLLTHYPEPKKEIWRTTANIAAIEVPQYAYNRVAETAIVKIDFRYIPDDSNFASKERLRNFLQQLAGKDASITIHAYEASHRVDATNRLLKQLSQAYKKVTHKDIKYIQRHGAADVRYYSERGIPAVTFGLPDHNTHAEGEYAEIAKMAQYEEVLTEFVRNPELL